MSYMCKDAHPSFAGMMCKKKKCSDCGKFHCSYHEPRMVHQAIYCEAQKTAKSQNT